MHVEAFPRRKAGRVLQVRLNSLLVDVALVKMQLAVIVTRKNLPASSNCERVHSGRTHVPAHRALRPSERRRSHHRLLSCPSRAAAAAQSKILMTSAYSWPFCCERVATKVDPEAYKEGTHPYYLWRGFGPAVLVESGRGIPVRSDRRWRNSSIAGFPLSGRIRHASFRVSHVHCVPRSMVVRASRNAAALLGRSGGRWRLVGMAAPGDVIRHEHDLRNWVFFFSLYDLALE